MILYILFLFIGLIIGFFISLYYIKKYVVKNLITKDFVKKLFISMGRTPSEKQINEVYNKIKF